MKNIYLNNQALQHVVYRKLFITVFKFLSFVLGQIQEVTPDKPDYSPGKIVLNTDNGGLSVATSNRTILNQEYILHEWDDGEILLNYRSQRELLLFLSLHRNATTEYFVQNDIS